MKTETSHKRAVDKFISIHKREPTAIDFDNTDYLPSARTIQRRYGGLKPFRLSVGLNTIDFTTGAARAVKAKLSTSQSMKDETKLFKALVSKYNIKNVSSPAKIFAYRGLTADIRLDIDNTTYLIDVFKPNTTHSFLGCVRIKNKKYLQEEHTLYPDRIIKFLYVCVNEEVMIPMKNPIPILSLEQFKKQFLS